MWTWRGCPFPQPQPLTLPQAQPPKPNPNPPDLLTLTLYLWWQGVDVEGIKEEVVASLEKLQAMALDRLRQGGGKIRVCC